MLTTCRFMMQVCYTTIYYDPVFVRKLLSTTGLMCYLNVPSALLDSGHK